MLAKVWGAEGGILSSAEVTGDIPFDITGFHFARKSDTPPLRSGFLTLMSPYEGKPFVTSASRLPVSGLDDYGGHALEVETTSGRRDVMAYVGPRTGRDPQLPNLSLKQRKIGDAFSMNGVFGLVSRCKEGALRQVFLVGGTSLASMDFGLETDRAEYSAAVTRVDRETGKIHLSAPLPGDADLAGSIAVIGSPSRSRAYQVKRLSEDRQRIQVEGSLLLYQSKIESVDPNKDELNVQFPPPFLRCDPHFYDGCAVTNESHSVEWRLRGVSVYQTPAGKRAKLAVAPANPSSGAFTDADEDGRTLVSMYEIAPGDTLKITAYASVETGADGQTVAHANVAHRFRSDR